MCIVNITKIGNQAALEALKKALFSELVQGTKEPQLGGHGSTQPQRLTPPEEPGKQKSPEVKAQEEPPKGMTAAGASHRSYREADTRQERRKPR